MEKLKVREILSYSFGGLGKNLAYMMVSTYTLYFYNKVLGVSASFVGTLLMIARIFDAFNDPIMGAIVSKTRTRWGRYKPWILSGAVLNSLVMIAMFNVPESMNLTGTKFYISVTYVLCGITYTLSDIPYWSVIPAITQPGRERENITLVTRILSGIGSGIATALSMFFVRLFGKTSVLGADGTPIINEKRGFCILAIVIAAVYTISTIITVVNLPREKYPEDSSLSVKEIFKALFQNDQAMCVAAIIICFLTAISITLNNAVYLFDFDLMTPELYTPFMVVLGVGQFLGMALYYPTMRKFMSNRKIFLTAICVEIIGYTILLIQAFPQKLSFLGLLIPCFFMGGGLGIAYILTTVFIANAVNYGEQKTGKRQNSLVSSLQTLMSKFATSLSVLIAGIGLDIVKYNQDLLATGQAQLHETLLRGRLLFAAPSLVFAVIALIFLLKRKDL